VFNWSNRTTNNEYRARNIRMMNDARAKRVLDQKRLEI
jgi:hypothetical protein